MYELPNAFKHHQKEIDDYDDDELWNYVRCVNPLWFWAW